MANSREKKKSLNYFKIVRNDFDLKSEWALQTFSRSTRYKFYHDMAATTKKLLPPSVRLKKIRFYVKRGSHSHQTNEDER